MEKSIPFKKPPGKEWKVILIKEKKKVEQFFVKALAFIVVWMYTITLLIYALQIIEHPSSRRRV